MKSSLKPIFPFVLPSKTNLSVRSRASVALAATSILLFACTQAAHAVTPFVSTATKSGHGVGHIHPHFIGLLIVLIVLGALVYAGYLAGKALSAAQQKKIDDYGPNQ